MFLTPFSMNVTPYIADSLASMRNSSAVRASISTPGIGTRLAPTDQGK